LSKWDQSSWVGMSTDVAAKVVVVVETEGLAIAAAVIEFAAVELTVDERRAWSS
jgi:hypothetical protein